MRQTRLIVKKENLCQDEIGRLNFASIVASLFILTFAFIVRERFTGLFSFYGYLNGVSLTVILFLLPSQLSKLKKWSSFFSEASMTLLTLLALVVIGYCTRFLPVQNLNTVILGTVAVVVCIISFFDFHFLFNRTVAVVTLVLITFIIVQLSSDIHSIFFFEKILKGTAHRDTLFHISIANMFTVDGYPSLGLVDKPLLHYHWFSHLTLSSLGRLTGIDNISMYNIIYPSIFIPLFIKSTYVLAVEYFEFKKWSKPNIWFYSVLLLTLSFFLNPKAFGSTSFLEGESFVLSLTLSFLYLSILINIYKEYEKFSGAFLVFSFIILLIIIFSKISTGVVLTGTLYCLSLLFFRRKSDVILVSILFSLILCISLIFIYPSPDPYSLKGLNLLWRIKTFFSYSFGLFTFSTGLILIWIIYINFSPQRSFLKFIRDKENIDFTFVFILTIIGLLGALYTSDYGSNSAYFGTVQFYFLVPLVIRSILWVFSKTLNFRAQVFVLICFLVSSVSSQIVVFQSFFEEKLIYQNLNTSGKDLGLYERMVKELYELSNQEALGNTTVYIPQDVNWFHESQNSSISNAFLVPALSRSAALIIPKRLLEKGKYGYGLHDYTNSETMENWSFEKVVLRAKELGYDDLLFFQGNDDPNSDLFQIINLTK